KKFTAFMVSIIIIQIPMMSYIASSSYIYENQFGLSSTMYSLYFAGTALVTVLGPILYIRIRKASSYLVSFGIFGICLLFGVLMFLIGHKSPLAFAVCFAPIMMMSAISRPFATAILLNMQRHDTGSASSLTNFSFTIMGAVGMSLITSIWTDYILGISMLAMITGVIGALFCLALRAKLGSGSLG
ncbi:MAG: MFS transporter, partial [Firmicutes bacterium]|nr:MFS transporter [Bacillota bacterium]